jgi:tetratricopeptide (TPR) repeat protein
VRLFLERAVFSSAGFSLTDQNAPAVAQVCHRLDGIPLAIELAAARVKAMPVEKLAERLDDRFRLLTGGSRAALPRQQTLRALIDWSYDLLSEPERVLLQRLSVFVGGWTLEAAEAICAGEGIEEWEVLDLLSALVEKSLVQYEEQGASARYRLLETVRQYSRDRLLESGNVETARRRHSDWYRALAEQAEPELRGAEQAEWLERLDLEQDNLRGALEWGLATDATSALGLAAALGLFWELRGYYTEGREALECGLERGKDTPGTVRTKALGWAGRLARLQGERERAKALLESCLALSRELGDRQGIAFTLNVLGHLAYGDWETATRLFEESLAISRELGDRWAIAHALSNLSGVARHGRGDVAATRTLHSESLAIQREIGDKRGMGWSLHGLGWAAQQHGDYTEARALFEESLAINREIGHKRGIAFSLRYLASVAQEQGDTRAARAYCAESLAIRRELGSRGEIAETLNGMGWVAQQQDDLQTARTLFKEALALAREGELTVPCVHALRKLAEIAVAQAEPARAARLFGAAEALRERPGSPGIVSEQRAHYERCVADARASMDEETFAAAWAEGSAMTLEAAIQSALDEQV